MLVNLNEWSLSVFLVALVTETVTQKEAKWYRCVDLTDLAIVNIYFK